MKVEQLQANLWKYFCQGEALKCFIVQWNNTPKSNNIVPFNTIIFIFWWSPHESFSAISLFLQFCLLKQWRRIKLILIFQTKNVLIIGYRSRHCHSSWFEAESFGLCEEWCFASIWPVQRLHWRNLFQASETLAWFTGRQRWSGSLPREPLILTQQAKVNM